MTHANVTMEGYPDASLSLLVSMLARRLRRQKQFPMR